MFVFKDINKTSTVIEQNVINYTQNLSASAGGIDSIKIISGSTAMALKAQPTRLPHRRGYTDLRQRLPL